MNDVHEGMTYSWEILTGVFDDKTSKAIRYASFLVLFLGIIWAGLNYFQADHISNLEEEVDYDTPYDAENRANNEAYTKLVDLAKTVGTMRRGGEAIANSMGGVSAMPFNIAGYNEMGLEDLDSPVVSVIPDSAPASEQQEEPQKENIEIKAVMVSRKYKYAVINYAQNVGYIIRQGQELPGGSGRVVRITKDGITVRHAGSNLDVDYAVK